MTTNPADIKHLWTHKTQDHTWLPDEDLVIDRAEGVWVWTEKGTKLLLDFPEPMMLRDGDGLVLDDGSVVVVAGEKEALLEISAKAPLDLVRLAWHIGNRHTDAQFAENHWVYLYYSPPLNTPTTNAPTSSPDPNAWDVYKGYNQLARFKLPSIELVRELPHSATGKVRKRELSA